MLRRSKRARRPSLLAKAEDRFWKGCQEADKDRKQRPDYSPSQTVVGLTIQCVLVISTVGVRSRARVSRTSERLSPARMNKPQGLNRT